MYHFKKTLIASVIGMILCCGLRLMARAEADRPNILIIFTDDQGINDVGCYGSELATPHIDSLAQDGLKFTQWYVASSICTPSRFGLLTGRNPSRSRDRLLGALMFLEARDGERGLRTSETTIASLLQSSGYRTGLVGKWHLGHGGEPYFPHQHGFAHTYGHTAGCVDFYTLSYGNTPDWYRHGKPLQQSGYATDLITDEAIDFLEQPSNNQPFFLFLAYNAPHFGKGWNDGDNKTVNLLQPHPRDLAGVEHIEDPTRRKYAAKVAALDEGIGRVLAALRHNDLDESTLVIFMTDHGGDPNYGGSNLPYRDGKATLFEGGIRVPCLMRWPGKIPAGQTTDSITSALDLFPTIAHLAKIPLDEHLHDGLNISDVLFQQTKTPQRQLFWELGPHAELGRERWLALRDGDWKYVQTPLDGEFLFNLRTDPYEKHNQASTEAPRLAAMQQSTRKLAEQYAASAR